MPKTKRVDKRVAAFHFVSASTQFIAIFIKIANAIVENMEDGISAKEAEVMARKVDLGNIKIKVKGHDVFDDVTQKQMQGVVGRLIRNVVNACA